MKREKEIIKISIINIIANVLLSFIKIIISLITNSITICLDAINNFSDSLSAIITIIGIKLANKSPDKDHPYGHGRLEYFTASIIGFTIFIVGILALKESIGKIITPVEPRYTFAFLLVIIFTVLVKYILSIYLKKYAEKINSDNLKATSVDAKMDAILSFSTFISGVLFLVWHKNIEGFLGVIISFLIIKNSIEILKRNISNIIGFRINNKLLTNIKTDIRSFEQVLAVYDLFLHNYGPTKTIGAVNIEVSDSLLASEIHILTRKINTKIYKKYHIFLTIGIYASNENDKTISKMKEKLTEIINNYSEINGFHAFYVDKENKVVSFDISLNFRVKDRIRIKKEIISLMKDVYPDYYYHIIIDNDFSNLRKNRKE